MARIPINGQSYEAFSQDANNQRTVNWYPEIDNTGLNNIILYPTPGLVEELLLLAQPIREMIESGDALYVVAGANFYRISFLGGGGHATTYLGALSTSFGPLSMATSGTEILLVDGTKGYLYNIATSTYTADIAATDPDFPDGADQCTFMDSYFIVNDPLNTNASGSPGAFFISGNYDGLSWSSLDYSIAERRPDQIKGFGVVNGQLWLVGETTTEVWYNSGNAIFPFERVNSAIIEWGTVAGSSVAEAENSLIFLSKNRYGQGQVIQTQGYQARRISNFALEQAIDGYSDIDDAFSYVMQYKGHTWYVLTFVSENKTWVFDMASGTWFEWSSLDDDSRHLSSCYAYVNETHLVGNYANGQIMRLSDSAYDDVGAAITRLRQTPFIHSQGAAIFGSALSLMFEQGVANASFPNPQVMLQWSDDGGHTWSSEYWRPILGQTGVYDLPATWTKLGRWYNRQFRIKVTDGVKAVLLDGYLSADMGEEDVRK